MNLVNHLAIKAKQNPDRIALIDAHQSMSYADLYAYVCGASEQLQGDGLNPGDTVLILQPVSIPLYISLLASFHAGLTVMFIDPSAGKDMIRHSLSLHPPQAFIGIAKAHLLRLSIPEIRAIQANYHSSMWVPASQRWSPARAECCAPIETTTESPALITFTSGSTGMPKAACRTHGFLLAQHQALAESLDYREGEIDLVTLPIFALANLASGLTSVIADTDLSFPAKANSKAIAAQCSQHQVTRCAASPAFFAKLHRDNLLPHFKAIYTGGAPVFPCLLDQIQSAYPDMKVITVFGSTEAEPIAHVSWTDITGHDRNLMTSGKGLLVGSPVKATQLRIIKDQTSESIKPISSNAFNDMELPSGEIGEIVVTGDHVLKGYLHGKGDEESKIHVENTIWHRTGDAAWLDDSKRVWLMGRCNAAIYTPEQATIYPFGIECVAMNHPAVNRCALLLHDHKVCLIIEGKLTPNQKEELQLLLSDFPIEQFLSIPHIPVDKRHNAKIDYPALRAALKSN